MIGKSAVISAALAAANEIVAAVPGYKIIVTGYVLIAAGTVNVTWKSGTTALSGAMPLTAQAGASAPLGRSEGVRSGWFETASGAALNLTCDQTVGVYGHVKFELEPA